MRASHYNLFVRDGERVFAVNLLSRAALDLSTEAYDAYLSLIDDPALAEKNPEHEEFAKVLRENLFLVEEDFDELGFIRDQAQGARFQSSQLGLVIAPTMGCNFNCHYCFEQKTEAFLDEASQERIVELVASRLAGFEELSVQWFGGEPLQAMDVVESLSEKLLGVAGEAGAAYAATVITNGSYLTESVSARLAKLGVQLVQITLDGDKELHDRTRREQGSDGSFEAILENIRATPAEISVMVRVHVAPFSLSSVSRLIERLGQEGMAEYIDTLYFAPLFNYRAGMTTPAYQADGKRFMTSEEFADIEIELLRAAKKWGFGLKDFLDVSYGVCTAVRDNTLIVDPWGNLTKCYKDVGVPSEAVGNLHLRNADWRSSDNAAKWLEVPIPRDDECRECQFLPVCLGGCSKQWQEGADKSVICTPLRYNWQERVRLFFDC